MSQRPYSFDNLDPRGPRFRVLPGSFERAKQLEQLRTGSCRSAGYWHHPQEICLRSTAFRDHHLQDGMASLAELDGKLQDDPGTTSLLALKHNL